MKRIILLLAVFISVLLFSASVYAKSDYIIEYDGIKEEYTGSIFKLMINDEFVETTVPPLIFNDYALVPIREVCEPMGALVNYISVSKQIFVNFPVFLTKYSPFLLYFRTNTRYTGLRS